jgi:hypothetical protein
MHFETLRLMVVFSQLFIKSSKLKPGDELESCLLLFNRACNPARSFLAFALFLLLIRLSGFSVACSLTTDCSCDIGAVALLFAGPSNKVLVVLLQVLQWCVKARLDVGKLFDLLFFRTEMFCFGHLVCTDMVELPHALHLIDRLGKDETDDSADRLCETNAK